MKILAVCGHGLGSSFMMEMNIKKVLEMLDINAEVGHSDLMSITQDDADLFVMAKDIANSATDIDPAKIVVVNNIISINEFEEKLREYFGK